ncbi:hypothetical protein K449DRAFT_207056 [Hypoxylon sp. EC38]|nr:hypothetical protein K449DRAFT_207056 [Hypoxylon sp. EC38]
MEDPHDLGSSPERPIPTPVNSISSEPAVDDNSNAPPTDDESTKSHDKGKGVDKARNFRDLRQPAVGSVTEILGYLPNPVEIYRPGAENPKPLELPIGNSHCYAATNPISCLPPPTPWLSQRDSEDEQAPAQAPRDSPKLRPIPPRILPPTLTPMFPPSRQRERQESKTAKEKKDQNIRDEPRDPEGSGSQEQKSGQNPDQTSVGKEAHTLIRREVAAPSRTNDEMHTPESKSVQRVNEQERSFSRFYPPPGLNQGDVPGVTPTRPNPVPLPPYFEDPPSHYATPAGKTELSARQAGIASLTPGFMTQDPVMQERLKQSMDIMEQQQRIIRARQLEARKQHSVLGKDPNNKKAKVLATDSAESVSGESQHSQIAQNGPPNQEKQPHWKAKASQRKQKKKKKSKTIQSPPSSEMPAASDAPLVGEMRKGPETLQTTNVQPAQNDTPAANVTSPGASHIADGIESLTLDEKGTTKGR